MQVDIRPFKPTDADELQRAVLTSVGHIGPWLDWCTPRYTRSDARDWVCESIDLWAQGLAFRWVIVGKARRDFLGCVEICMSTCEEHVGQMGYWVRRQAIGQGVCSQGAAQALDWAFNALDLQRVELFVQPSNDASIGVAHKLGAELIDQQHDQIFYNGQSQVANRYQIEADSSAWADLVPARRRRWPLMPEYPNGTGDRLSAGSEASYEFRSSAKKA